MRSETPFLNASNALSEGCNWLEDLVHPEGDSRSECDTHADAWEQAESHLSRAIAELEEHGLDRVEKGGSDVPGHGWVPAFGSVVIYPPAVDAAEAIRAFFKPLQSLQELALIVPAVTPDVIASLRSALAPFQGRIGVEQDHLDAQPEPY